ncbi:hypothetical protein H2203_002917 [Taxawa tesnikishii (nom. ined.)]|nr:hypothetical protein H2203_002917 [Dothideales sp. JES 119]
MPRYPSRAELEELVSNLDKGKGNQAAFLSRVSPNVDWEVMGSGRFHTLKDWKEGALDPINSALKEPLQLRVRNVIGGDREWAVVELTADSTCKNGMQYPQRYAWVMRFDENGIIVQVRAYLDTQLVQKAMDGNT